MKHPITLIFSCGQCEEIICSTDLLSYISIEEELAKVFKLTGFGNMSLTFNYEDIQNLGNTLGDMIYNYVYLKRTNVI